MCCITFVGPWAPITDLTAATELANKQLVLHDDFGLAVGKHGIKLGFVWLPQWCPQKPSVLVISSAEMSMFGPDDARHGCLDTRKWRRKEG